MDVRAFRDSPTGRVVATAHGWAFVPQPLPPRLVVDIVLEQQLATTDRALSELAGLRPSLGDVSPFVAPILRREASFSCRLAGLQVDLIDLYACQAEGSEFAEWAVQGDHGGVRAALALAQTLDWAYERLSDTTVTTRWVRELHARMHGRQAPAKLRQTQTWLGAAGSTLEDADYVPPPPEEIPAALHHLEAYLQLATDAQYPPLVRLAFAYYQVEAIQPFADANGRVGRALLSLLPCVWGWLAQPVLMLSAGFAAAPERCNALLLEVSRSGDWRSWVLYFLRIVERQAHDALRRTSALHRVSLAYHDRLEHPSIDSDRAHGRSPALLHRLPERLLAMPILTAGGLQSILEVNRHRAERTTEWLVEMGILTPLPALAGRSVDDVPRPPLYAAMEILNAVVL
jgi:Fic family protein